MIQYNTIQYNTIQYNYSCLIKGWKDVICKLHLRNGSCPCYSCSDAEPCNALLAQGSIEHAVLAVLVLKADCTSETIKLVTHVHWWIKKRTSAIFEWKQFYYLTMCSQTGAPQWSSGQRITVAPDYRGSNLTSAKIYFLSFFQPPVSHKTCPLVWKGIKRIRKMMEARWLMRW